MADDKKPPQEAVPERISPAQLMRVDEKMAQQLGCKGMVGLKEMLSRNHISPTMNQAMGGLCIRGNDYERLLAAQQTQKYRFGDDVPEKDPNRKKPSNRTI